jgi:hypothetical protein
MVDPEKADKVIGWIALPFQFISIAKIVLSAVLYFGLLGLGIIGVVSLVFTGNFDPFDIHGKLVKIGWVGQEKYEWKNGRWVETNPGAGHWDNNPSSTKKGNRP